MANILVLSNAFSAYLKPRRPQIFEKITLRERELLEVRQFLDYGLAEYQKRGFLLNEQDLSYIQPHLEILDLSGELKEFVDESIKSAGKKKENLP